jgi:hypothetical protein
MFGRRLAILVIVLMGLTALAASVSPPPQTVPRNGTPTPSPSPSPAPTPTPTPDSAVSGVVVAHLEIGPPGAPLAHVRARAGETVMLEVSGDVVDSVTVGDLPVIEPIDPDTPAQLQITTDAPGSYPVRLLDHHRDVGVLDVSARG